VWLDNSASKHHFCKIDIDGGVLTFKAMDANHDVFDELIIVKNITGTSDFRSTSSWIYPNPANDFVTLQLGQPGEYSIEMLSLNGQIIQRRNTMGSKHQIDLSTFQKGTYIITIRSKDFVKTEKIIKL